MRLFLVVMCLIITAMACSSVRTPTPTLDLTPLEDLEELVNRVKAAKERGRVLSDWSIALEAAYKHPDNPLYCEDFALVFRSADEMRKSKGGFVYYDGEPDPAYDFVAVVLSSSHDYYNAIAELDKTEVGKELQKYAEKFEKWPEGIPANIQQGYIELEYYFSEVEAVELEGFEFLTDAVNGYEQQLDSVETVLSTMENIRQNRGCG